MSALGADRTAPIGGNDVNDPKAKWQVTRWLHPRVRASWAGCRGQEPWQSRAAIRMSHLGNSSS